MNNIKKEEVAVVTGAGGTLCSELAVDLARKGYRVALIGRSLEKLRKTEKMIKEADGNVLSVSCDVRNLAEVKRAHALINEQFGACSILINGAGGNQPEAVTNINEFNERELEEEQGELRGFFNLDMSRFLDVIDVNIMGTVIPCQVFAPDMVGQRMYHQFCINEYLSAFVAGTSLCLEQSRYCKFHPMVGCLSGTGPYTCECHCSGIFSE